MKLFKNEAQLLRLSHWSSGASAILILVALATKKKMSFVHRIKHLALHSVNIL